MFYKLELNQTIKTAYGEELTFVKSSHKHSMGDGEAVGFAHINVKNSDGERTYDISGVSTYSPNLYFKLKKHEYSKSCEFVYLTNKSLGLRFKDILGDEYKLSYSMDIWNFDEDVLKAIVSDESGDTVMTIFYDPVKDKITERKVY